VIRIARNRAQGKNITFEVASMERQPLQSQSCDVALSALMFHHLPPETKRAALHEVRRILKPNGVFLLCDFSTPVKRYWWLSVEFWQRIEPEVKPQIEGQLFTLAQEANASIETLQTFYGCIALHLLKFRDGA
jgi:ubiquinone/menaquinone biosynthesis C-methylase UbiE